MLTKGLFFAGTLCCAATLLLASTVGVNAWRNEESPLLTMDRFAHRWNISLAHDMRHHQRRSSPRPEWRLMDRRADISNSQGC